MALANRLAGAELARAAELIPYLLAERAITPRYQPIVDLDTGELVGVEALARGPAGSLVEFPDMLFAAAEHAGLLAELDMLCATRALEDARDARTPAPLVFVNAEPVALNQPLSPDLIAVISDDLTFRIVLELTERALAVYPAALLNIANLVHRFGNSLALDDVGADPMSLAFLPLIEPEVVKLDMHLVRHPCAPETVDTAVTVSAFAERTGATVLAEGIESEADLAHARALGARWGQGWLFGRPTTIEEAVRGRAIHPYARLRPSLQELHMPVGSPFVTASAHRSPRLGGADTIRAHAEHLLRVAEGVGEHAVVLGAYTDPATVQRWLPRLTDLATRVAFVGMSGPAAPGVDSPLVHPAPPPDLDTALVVVAPHTAAALCMRPAHDGAQQFVLTHDVDVVHALARMLLRRFDTAPDLTPLRQPPRVRAAGAR